MSARRRGPYWYDEDTWVCPMHMCSVRLPKTAGSCYYAGCTTQRPEYDGEVVRPKAEQIKAVPVPAEPKIAAATPAVAVCEWHSCAKPVRVGSKYCSRECSNRNARARYRARKRQEKSA